MDRTPKTVAESAMCSCGRTSAARGGGPTAAVRAEAWADRLRELLAAAFDRVEPPPTTAAQSLEDWQKFRRAMVDSMGAAAVQVLSELTVPVEKGA